MSLRFAALSFLMLLLAGMPLLARASPRYTIRVLGSAGSAATAINNSGDVVGQGASGEATHAFFYTGNTQLDLGTFGGANSAATAINDRGVVVGYADNAEGNMRAFVYASGVMVDLGTLGGATAAAYGINNSGHIVGGASTGVDGDAVLPRAFVYAAGNMQMIFGFPQGDSSVAFDINNAGLVVGRSAISSDDPPEHPYHAFLYRDGVTVDLGTLGGLYSSANAINEAGIIVGQASTAELFPAGHFVPHAFMFEDGIMFDLGTLGGEQSISAANDINARGQIVGSAETAGDTRAFLYENGNMLDLNSLVDPASGWLITDAHGINDYGQIAATGCRDGDCYALRLDDPALLAEPPVWGWWLLGMTLMGALRRKRTASGVLAQT
jgi:probable HAF family extracellular repeat protein